MIYEKVAHFAATYAPVFLMVLFAGVLVYTFWPKNKDKFEKAARRPLEED